MSLAASSIPDRSESVATVDRRKERRYRTNDPVEIKILPDVNRIPALMVDVSKSGMRLALAQPLEAGAKIEILTTAGALVIFGEVRYCRRSAGTYYAGVLIENVIYREPDAVQHISEDDVVLYVLGKGLKVAEYLRLERHIRNCPSCMSRVSEAARTVHVRRLPPRPDLAP